MKVFQYSQRVDGDHNGNIKITELLEAQRIVVYGLRKEVSFNTPITVELSEVGHPDKVFGLQITGTAQPPEIVAIPDLLNGDKTDD